MKRDDVPVAGHRLGICRHRQGLLRRRRAEAGQCRARPRLATPARRGPRQGPFVSRTPAEREARRTADHPVPPRRRLSARRRSWRFRSARLPASICSMPTSRWRRRPSRPSTSAWRSARCPPPRSSARSASATASYRLPGHGGGRRHRDGRPVRGDFLAVRASACWGSGCGGAFVQQYRFAAADNAPPEFKARAISFVLAGGVFTGDRRTAGRDLHARAAGAGHVCRLLRRSHLHGADRRVDPGFLLRLKPPPAAAANGAAECRHARSPRSSRSRASSWRWSARSAPTA